MSHRVRKREREERGERRERDMGLCIVRRVMGVCQLDRACVLQTSKGD